LTKKKARPQSENQPERPVEQRVPIFDEVFRQDLKWWFKVDSGKANKILDLVTDVMRTPFEGIGKPEPLKYMDADTWSRRIDLEHRLVYRVRGDRVDFLACRYHY
jgi:toxin YoeB